jgi:magnesium chelatase family protein
VEVPPLEEPLVAGPGAAAPEPSARVRARVDAARKRMLARQGVVNARLGPRDLDEVVPLTREQAQLLDLAVRRLGLSARAIDRVRRTARSIADLADAPAVGIDHLAEAIGYRDLDRRTGEGAAA